MTRRSGVVRPSSRVTFAFAWLFCAITVVLAGRKVLAVPDGRGDVNGLLVATVAGFCGLALLGAWLGDYESRDMMSNRPPAAVPDEVQAVTAHCRSVLPVKETWFAPPGWPDSLALCILDAVWSLGSTYKTVVFPILDRYCDHRRAQGAAPKTDSAVDLMRVFDEVGGPPGFADQIGNHRPAHTKRGAPLKAASVRRAAEVLAQYGVTTTADLLAAVALPHQPLKAAWHRVPGNGVASWRYLLMLAGDEHIKPDRMVRRFVANALGAEERAVPMVRAADVLAASAAQQEVRLRVLDHTVWLYQSGLARRRRR